MPADLAAIAAHAEVLRADADALTACADRLGEIAAALEADGIAPSWLRESVNAHRAACTTAAADLNAAAARLHRYGGGAAHP